MANQSLVLVDGSYYLFRAYHALPDFTNSSGEHTGAIFGVINMLHKLLEAYRPDFFAVVFDAKGKNFRNDWYPAYKANRPPMPDDLASQIQPLHDIIRAEGFPLLIIKDVEADDVIATLASNAQREGLTIVVSTGDKDLAQIVNDKVSLINTMTNITLDPEGVEKKFGVRPQRIIDYLTLVGDTSDNIPGVPGVGPKTAAKWIQQYGSLDGIIQHADDITGKVGENLRASLEQLPLCKNLVTVRDDVALDFNVDKLKRSQPDLELLAEYFKKYEFKSFLAQLPINTGDPVNEQKDQADRRYDTILTASALNDWIERLDRAELIAFDTETTSLDYMKAVIVGVSFAVQTGEAAYVPLAHDYAQAPQQLDRNKVLTLLEPLLSSPDRPKLGHNLKYDKNVLANHGIVLDGIRHDSMLESYVLDSTASRHDMDSLALKYLGINTIHYEDVAGKGVKQVPFNHVDIESAAPYAAEDADITLQLHQLLWPRLQENRGLRDLYEKIEVPLLSVLSDMERHGVMIDREMLRQQSVELTERMGAIERDAHNLAGQTFNIGSPKQIQSVLYDKMNLPVLSKTPKGQPSTAEAVLQQLAVDYELPGLILEHRALSKLITTYTNKLPELINPKTGRVHTSYHQAVAATGRLSSSDPNLQNIPVRSEDGRKIRQAFIAAPGFRLLAADYSQIELRIMAHLSGDPALLAAFANNEDIHRTTAAEVFGITDDQVSSEQRRAAKAINFGLIYGMSPFGLSRQLGIQIAEAREYVEKYFDRYPAVKSYMDNTRETARQQGYVETVFGRRLYLPEINSRNATRRQYAERTAINAPMQGTAADIIKRAMIDIHNNILRGSDRIRMIMQVHDELVFEVAEGSINDAKSRIAEIMMDMPELDVPLVIDIGIGDNWDEAH